ncbi:uncharacterized protein LOC129963543 isoform X1 [Argiope bruennichi]|uniref:uncharacterized protein LOC129963543 isoform X1 n=1 Tax=Argiope bruennichi TaxID=94029 RepID=UPI002494E0F5|nr:uncharacterized protein LOC129963543 isoform X1 [Argiope bruennichi]
MSGMKVLLFAIISTVCNCAVLQDSTRMVLNEEDLQESTNPSIPYNFEYDSRDQNGTLLFRKESKDGSGKVEGRYGYKDMHGIERIVEYVADKDGYRAKIRTNEPGIDRTNSAGVEFYADTSNQHVQIAKKNGENVAAIRYSPDVTAEEKKNLVAEKVNAEIANQYSEVLSHPSSLRSQHHLFPQRQSDILRLNKNVQLNSVQLNQPREIPTTPSSEYISTPQQLHYSQQFSAVTDGRQQFEVLNAQAPATQYVSSQAQPQLIPANHQVVAIPLDQFYIPQNQQPVALQNGAVSSTTQVQTLAPQVIPSQPYYSLESQPQQGSWQVPSSYAQASPKGTEYTPLGRQISGLSKYFQ